MCNKRIISKKIAYCDTGVFGPNIIEAEVAIIDNEGRRYIRCEWCGEDEYSLRFEVTTDSTFDLLVNMGDIEKIELIREKSLKELGSINSFKMYPSECKELTQMISSFIYQSGIYDLEETSDFISEWQGVNGK